VPPRTCSIVTCRGSSTGPEVWRLRRAPSIGLVFGAMGFFRRSDSGDADANVLVDMADGKYHVGEQWNYRTRPGEERSVLTVLKVESSPKLGVIVHVSLDGLRIESSHAPDGVLETIGHMPFAEHAIDDSVTTRVAAGIAVPAESEGYQEWRRAFDAGEAGIFTISVGEGVSFMAEALSQ
jgi:hypothetical protein